MTTAKDILKEAARIVRAELPKHLPDDFVISNVEAESLSGPDREDYIHVNVILEDDHPELDARKLLTFKQTMHPMFERAGITPSPTISYSNRGELAK
jgi:hypothetical protein